MYFSIEKDTFGQGTIMKNVNLRLVLSILCFAAMLSAFVRVDAGPVRFDQVTQIVNPKPGKADSVNFARLTVGNYYDGILIGSGDDDDDKKKEKKPQDGRVITETTSDIVVEEDCNCDPDIVSSGFPKWALLGLGAIPVAFILIRRKKDEPTPTPTIPGQTPTPTPTPTTPTPTPTPTTPTPTPKTPTPTPPITPTPTPPQPVPEPVTILLFGTGLASIGLAARRKFGKKSENGDGTGPEGEE